MIVTIIPARGNSKGIARKNLMSLGNKPLLQWTIDASLKARSVDRTIVTTESEEIAGIARQCGAEAVIRPESLSEDDVHAIEPTIHAVETLEPAPEYVFMLLPTAPFRGSVDIERCISELRQGIPSIIGVSALSKGLNSLRYIVDDQLEPVVQGLNPHEQRQSGPLFAVNGAIFGAKWSLLREHGTFHMPNAAPYYMGAVASVDINTPDELDLARRLVRHL